MAFLFLEIVELNSFFLQLIPGKDGQTWFRLRLGIPGNPHNFW